MDEDGSPWVRARDELRYRIGRSGDHLITPFQCGICHFRNIQKRDPIADDPCDRLLMKNIRRATMDALWSREPATVYANMREVKKLASAAEAMGLGHDLLPRFGPNIVKDIDGVRVACMMLERSRGKGKHAATVQFGTARKSRSAYSNLFGASVDRSSLTSMSNGQKKMIVTSCETSGVWFEKFALGCHKRMGDVVKPDQALSMDELHLLIAFFEKEFGDALTLKRRTSVLLSALFVIIGFMGGLRGEEVVMFSYEGLRKYVVEALEHPEHPHVPVTLLGRFKGETGDRYHIMPIALVSKSGVTPVIWIVRLLELYEQLGIQKGWVFRTKKGDQAKQSDYEGIFFEGLRRIQEDRPDLIGADVNVEEDYALSRSLRRTSTTQARNEQISDKIVEENNRWRKAERAKGRMPSLPMRLAYADVKLSLKTRLEYSSRL